MGTWFFEKKKKNKENKQTFSNWKITLHSLTSHEKSVEKRKKLKKELRNEKKVSNGRKVEGIK